MDGEAKVVKIPPVGSIYRLFNRRKRSIFIKGGEGLQELPFKINDRVRCRGFEGKLYPGTVLECNWTNAGYARFILVRVKLDNIRGETRVNWSLFPDRVCLLKEE
ncbi:MAG: hypothetical protein CMB77_03665 [Euryarchaeota archaeon]|nr:hypothetical protein [Euryarchaeota archaeon]|tara:strand:- start:25299 stop:25613 length:315 start_codon:yes stop_codon:yes gene_type:complete